MSGSHDSHVTVKPHLLRQEEGGQWDGGRCEGGGGERRAGKTREMRWWRRSQMGGG